ncbi:MAG: hypothetical protein IT581_17960 [Verrucomicrobiales bacterium]|nr:hypothetical protein [Verrucomicrobiales bacterium]
MSTGRWIPAKFEAGPGDVAKAGPGHPPIETIPALPIPDVPAGKAAHVLAEGLEQDALLRYDVRTRRVTEWPSSGDGVRMIPDADAAVGGTVGGYEGLGATGSVELPRDDFGQFAKVPDTKLDPWRMNVKLVMEFPLLAGGFAYYVASGSMLDAEVVITAAHCVFNPDPSINAWATRIWAYPGWDGMGMLTPAGPDLQPFGWAEGTTFYASTNFVSGKDFDRDVGLVFLPRAVGLLTGWFGRAWGYDCATSQARRYFNASYPAQACGQAGLHTGKDMMYWSGTIDRCLGNQFELSTTPGCYTAVWGGMSGSGLYFLESGQRFVHAISSTSDRSTIARYCRIWDQLAAELSSSLIPASRGSAFDLQALDCNVATTNAPAGRVSPLRNHLVVNPTDFPASKTFKYRVYLSANDNISATDTLLGEQTYSASLPAMGALRVVMPPVVIPTNTPPGDYWIGVEYDAATDGDAGNNDTDGWDAVRIRVLPPLKTLSVTCSGANAEVMVSASPLDFDGLGAALTPFDRSYSTGETVQVSCPSVAPNGSVFLQWRRDGLDWTNTPSVSVTMSASTALTAVYQNSFLTVDNQDGPVRVELTGSWSASSTASGSWGTNYLHDGNSAKGTKVATFIPTLPDTASYEVFLWYTAQTNRASNVPVEVVHANGTATRTINQRIQGGQWVSLGTYPFAAGLSGRVRLLTTGTDGFVIADAVRWVEIMPSQADYLTVDNLDGPSRVEITGAWSSSTSVAGFWGSDYVHDGNAGKGAKSITFIPTVGSAGSYETFVWYSAAAGRATNVPVDILHADGRTTRLVNQLVNGNQWVSVGNYRFDSGTAGRVTVRTTGTVGWVTADAIRLVPAALRIPVVVDNGDDAARLQLEGAWSASTTSAGYWASNYLHNGNTGRGTKSVTFIPSLAASGSYEVSMWYTSGTNRANNVPVDITHLNGTTTRIVNQQVNGSQWVSLGTYSFGGGTAGRVRVRTAGVNGFVIADAVQWMPSAAPALTGNPGVRAPTPRFVRWTRPGNGSVVPAFEVELNPKWDYVWEGSTNWMDWQPVQEGHGGDHPILLMDPEAGHLPFRFYRLQVRESGLADFSKGI